MSENLKTGKRMYATGDNGRSKRGREKEARRVAHVARIQGEQRKRAEARARFEQEDARRFEELVARLRGWVAA